MNPHRIPACLAVAGLFGMMSAGSLSAQQPGEDKLPSSAMMGLPGAQRHGTDPLQLLQVEQVKKELKLSEDQIAKLKKISDDLYASTRQQFGEKGQPFADADARAAVEKHVTAARDQVAKVLDEAQISRFKEIILQVCGWDALTDKETAEALKLTSEQQNKIGKIATDSGEKMRGKFEVPRGGNAEERAKVMSANAKKMQTIFDDSDTVAKGVLTDDQQKTLEKMRGKPFKLDPAQLKPVK